jgi:sugar phosphate isomerase/epimerase
MYNVTETLNWSKILDTRTAQITRFSPRALRCLVVIAVFVAGYVFQPCFGQGKKRIPGSWKLGTASGLFPDFTPETLKEVKESGIEHVELNWKPELVNGTPAERLAFAQHLSRDAKKAGLVIWSTHIPYGKKFDLAETDPEKRPEILRNVKEYIDLAMELKVKQIVVHPSTEPIADSVRASRIQACRESLKELSVYCRKKGASLNIECLPRTCLGNTSTEILQILDGIDNIGICFDSNHLLKETPENFVRAVNKRIRMLHISDYDNVNERHWLPGQGIINWNKVISALVEVGYKGSFMYEAVKKPDNTYTFKDLKPNFESLKKAWINQL